MARIGEIIFQNRDYGEGKIETLAHAVSFRLDRLDTGGDKNKPTFAVKARAASGASIEIGALWERETKDGSTYYFGLLDDPSFPAPLRFSAFRGRAIDLEAYDCVWSRDVVRAA